MDFLADEKLRPVINPGKKFSVFHRNADKFRRHNLSSLFFSFRPAGCTSSTIPARSSYDLPVVQESATRRTAIDSLDFSGKVAGEPLPPQHAFLLLSIVKTWF